MRQDPREYGIFTGFNIKYPEYTVVTPQLGLPFNVRGLNVDEVSQIRTSSTTPAKATDLINRVLWSSITNPPKQVPDFDTFMRYTTLKDREALMFGLYIMTFGEDREFRVICNDCGKERELKVKMTDMFKINPYPASDGMVNTYNMEVAAGVEQDEMMEDIKAAKGKKKVLQRPPEGEEVEEPSQEKKMEDIRKNMEVDQFDDPEEDGIGLGAPAKNIKHPESTKEQIKPEPIKPVHDPRMTTPIDIPSKKENTPELNKDVLNIINREMSVELPISKIVAILRQPTILDEHQILNDVPFLQKKHTEIINETMIIKRFEQPDPNQRVSSFRIENREDILKGYRSLPNLDKKEIYDRFKENFADYGIELKTNWDCLDCGAENEMEINIVTQFFRMVSFS